MSAPPNFDLLARVYAPLEWLSFGRALALRRNRYLRDPRVAGMQRALVLGDGDGRFTAALLALYPSLHVTAVDASRAMLAELARRVAHSAPLATLHVECADLRVWEPRQGGYDLIAAHFFFDCLSTNEVAALVTRLLPALAPDARWLVSDFAIPAQGAAASFARLLVRALYLAFYVLTRLRVKQLPDYETSLKSAGFGCSASETAIFGTLRAELWLRSAQGGRGVDPQGLSPARTSPLG